MGLQEFWFVIMAVLFLGFFVLEGFDFGVGMLMAFFGRTAKGDRDKHRRAALNTIGPVWDGNEVWLITAAGAVFVALKTDGAVRLDAFRFATRLSLPVTALMAGFGLWTQLAYGKDWTWIVVGIGAVATLAALARIWSGSGEGWAFVHTTTVV